MIIRSSNPYTDEFKILLLTGNLSISFSFLPHDQGIHESILSRSYNPIDDSLAPLVLHRQRRAQKRQHTCKNKYTGRNYAITAGHQLYVRLVRSP